MKFLILVLGVTLALGQETQVFRPQVKHLPSTCRVQTKTVTETVTVSTCTRGPGIPRRRKKCGNVLYDPSKYICRRGDVLCPVINGEPLSLCNETCFATFTHKCHNNTHIQPLPELPGRFTLLASNPLHPHLHNTPITVCNATLRIGGRTCSYCPPQVPSCPPGNTTIFNAANSSSMAVMVPGGQGIFLLKDGSVGVGRAHSGFVPPGARMGRWRAFEGGGWSSGIWEGWEACGGKHGVWRLRGRNGTSVEDGSGRDGRDGRCFGVNLRVKKAEGLGAWEYT